MRYASSIKYGGLLIDANTADYSSFLKLGLVCPYCAENVYLVGSKSVAATKRKLRSGKTTQVKGYTCESYFAHYSDVDATECELRCAKTGKADYQKSQAKAKLQLKSIFEEKFLDICKLNPRFDDFDFMRLQAHNNFVNHDKLSNYESYCRKLIAHLRTQDTKEIFKKQIVKFLGYLQNIDGLNHLEYLKDSTAELNLHREICFEALNYLLAPTSFKVFLPIFQILHYECLVVGDLIGDKIESPEEHVFFNYLCINGLLGYTPYSATRNGLIKLDETDPVMSAVVKKLHEVAYGTESNLVHFVNLLAAVIACVPWAKGFTKNKSDFKTAELYSRPRAAWLIYEEKGISKAVAHVFESLNECEPDPERVKARGLEVEQLKKFYRELSPYEFFGINNSITTIKSFGLSERNQMYYISFTIYNQLQQRKPHLFIVFNQDKEEVCRAIFWRKIDGKREQRNVAKLLPYVLSKKLSNLVFAAPGIILSGGDERIQTLLINFIVAFFETYPRDESLFVH